MATNQRAPGSLDHQQPGEGHRSRSEPCPRWDGLPGPGRWTLLVSWLTPGQLHGPQTRFVDLDKGRVYVLVALLRLSTFY